GSRRSPEGRVVCGKAHSFPQTSEGSSSSPLKTEEAKSVLLQRRSCLSQGLLYHHCRPH
ncbi:mCG1041170, partial [Mus musculus]